MRRYNPGDYSNPMSPGNSPDFRTGRLCVERDCPFEAGTFWSKLWCVRHNIERMERIGGRLAALAGGK